MDYSDFIKDGDLDDLPDDPQLRFVAVATLALGRFNEAARELNSYQDEGAYALRQAEYGLHNVIFGAAKFYKVEPFASQSMPAVRDYDDNHFRQFRFDLNNYITQISLGQAEQQRTDSLPLPQNSSDKIKTYIFHLRAVIDKAEGITDAKRAALHKRLDALEAELGRKRVRYFMIARVIVEILAIPGALAQTYDLIEPLATKIMREIGQAKIADDEQQQIPFREPFVLLPPRTEEEQKKAGKPKSRNFAADLDDEIPF